MPRETHIWFRRLSGEPAVSWSHLAFKGPNLPPGPRTNWLGFNVVDLPKVRPWLTYAQWKNVYGDLIYIRVLGNPILVINSAAVATELLEKRGAKYSSRPVRTMIVDLIGWDWLVSVIFHRHLPGNESSISWHPLQIQETHAMMRRFAGKPQGAAACIVLKMTYGLRVGAGDEYIMLADKALASLAQAGIFGTYLVDYLPFLKYAPSCFSFRRKALKWRKLTRAMLNTPFTSVKEELARGTASKCLVSEELERLAGAPDPADEQIIKNVSAISSFFLVMSLYPDVQARGQKEIDMVIGLEHRLPVFTDRPQLPFILLRWNPVTPLGVAHYISEDDIYKGYRIPKVLLPNVWAILHDPDMYPDPLSFNPQRFAPENRVNGLNQIPDPAFGFGRRLASLFYIPSNNSFIPLLAFDTLWIVVASMLTVYNISKEVDEDGRVKEPVAEFTPYSLSHPMPFACTIEPRGDAARQLILQTEIQT
ncbi:cytochrome P450 [Mycena alexandri]|uniref:Cytochrome P450 n=1 Tax=Mycena alexandri TaxID=1745969 RepID=A0AAD6T3F5_9AGAR|nr:cytochrome P450 [Mycena alexandri]